MAGPVRLQDTKYLFVDSGNFSRYFYEATEKWAGTKPTVDYSTLAHAYSPHKTFFYDCIDDTRRANESDGDFKNRLEAQEQEFAQVSSEIGTHVRLGSMTGKYKNRRQKGVDILLAVDVLRHAERRNMDTVLLLSGDGDFRPLVETLVEMGLSAWVLGDKKHTSRELRLAADRYFPLDLIHYYGWAEKTWRDQFPLPGMTHGLLYMHHASFQLIGEGTVGEKQAWLYRKSDAVGIMIESREDDQHLNLFHPSYERLKLFCELTQGVAEFNVEP